MQMKATILIVLVALFMIQQSEAGWFRKAAKSVGRFYNKHKYYVKAAWQIGKHVVGDMTDEEFQEFMQEVEQAREEELQSRQ
uniref:styelin-D-like n=1 Tax=Styela clava TaxID=7725 RepID=UPI001939ECEC|nr:styelin-D-like [Styela clava]XP_039264046.1 styelin-D-like [Styela clava]